MRLVFSGSATEELVTHAERSNVGHRVVFLGRIPEERLASVYRGASALLFASLYEGFGLPVIEAMACGTPVITSNTTALPEVAGRAALLVNPESVADTADAIRTILSDGQLRESLRANGYRQAAKFTWEATAAKVVMTLNNAGVEGRSTA
jgi:glycosyltransferase involved in cell wall biosynthesis